MLAVLACLGTGGVLEAWKDSGSIEEEDASSGSYGDVLAVSTEGSQHDNSTIDTGN